MESAMAAAHRRRTARKRYDRIRADPVWQAKDVARRKTARFKTIGPRYRKKLKLQGLVAYGGPNPKCAWCGESDVAKLSLDHVNGDGAAHRRALGAARCYSDHVYRRLRDLGWPNSPPIQVLCIAHNSMKQNQPDAVAYTEALRLARAIVRRARRKEIRK